MLKQKGSASTTVSRPTLSAKLVYIYVIYIPFLVTKFSIATVLGTVRKDEQ